MPNLKLENFTLRGKVGELISRSHVPFSSRIQELSPKYLYKRFSFGFIPDKQRNFLIKYWKSFDLIRLVTSDDGKRLNEIEIYEVKTQSDNRKHKPEITGRSFFVYRKAKQLGIKTKTVKVTFYDDWEYKVEIEDFNEERFDINNGNEKTSSYLNFLKKSQHF